MNYVLWCTSCIFSSMNTATSARRATPKAPWIAAFTLITSLSCGATLATDGAVYKSTGEDGSVVFTDKRTENGKFVDPGTLNQLIKPRDRKDTNSVDVADTRSTRPDDRLIQYDGAPFPAKAVTKVSIVQPKNGQTLINPSERINVSITGGTDGELPDGFIAVVNLNGQQVAAGSSTTLGIPVPRDGNHVIQASVYNPAGDLAAKSRSVKVFVVGQ